MRLLAFGKLSHLPVGEIEIPAHVADTISLRRFVGARWPELNDPGVRLAVNQTLVNEAVPLTRGDEVAFLPPMSGG
jgi:molybdopterin converting factor small subunit